MVERSGAFSSPASEPGRAADEAALGAVFAALADPTRRRILTRLREGTATVSALAEPLPISFAAVSKHVQVLERAGLLRREVRGREHRLSLEAAPLQRAAAWTLQYRGFWTERLAALEALLRDRKVGSARPRRR